MHHDGAALVFSDCSLIWIWLLFDRSCMMEWIHFGLAFLLLSSKALGLYNYPTPATSFNGVPAQQQTSPGGFPQPSPSGQSAPTVYPSSGIFQNGFPKQGEAFAGPSGQPGGYPERPQIGANPSVQPTGRGYPAAGTPSGPAFPQQPNVGHLGTSLPGSGSTTNFPTNGLKPVQSPTTHAGYPFPEQPANPNFPTQQSGYPSSSTQRQEGLFVPQGGNGNQERTSSSYPGQEQGTKYPGSSQSNYAGTQRPQNASPAPFAGQNGKPETPQGGAGIDKLTGLDQFPGTEIGDHRIEEPSEAVEGDYSAIPGEPDIDYPILSLIPTTSFSCDQQQYPGYYADLETRCQVFHICANNKTYDFLCPNGTIFHQEYFVCVWWNQFDCNSAQSLYEINANIYDYQISVTQQQTGAIPAGLDGEAYSNRFAGTQGPSYPANGSPQGSGAGTGGFQSPGSYQPTGPGAQSQISSEQTKPSYSSPAFHVPDGSRPQASEKGDIAENPPQPPQGPQRPSTSPQAPNYPLSGQGYSSNRPQSTPFQSSNFEGPSKFAGATPSSVSPSTEPGRYPISNRPTQAPQYLPPKSGFYSGSQKPSQGDVIRGQSINGFSRNQQPNRQQFIENQQKTNGYSGSQPTGGYSGGQQTPQRNAGSQQSTNGFTGSQQSNPEYTNEKQSTEGYPSNQKQNGGYHNELQPSAGYSRGRSEQSPGEYPRRQQSIADEQESTYPGNQQSDGGYPSVQKSFGSYSSGQLSGNAQKPGGSPTREYLPSVTK